jgi:hypothetical protein
MQAVMSVIDELAEAFRGGANELERSMAVEVVRAT